MKVISKERQEAHYNEVIKAGITGGSIGLGFGLAGVVAASRRYAAFRSLTVAFRTFLVSSAAIFGAITTADRRSIALHRAQNPMHFYKDESQRVVESARQHRGRGRSFFEWGRENRYTIVFTSWIAAMALAMTIVSRNRYLSMSQKLVQARMYAQGLTLAVLVATAALETRDAKAGKGRWETVLVLDPNDPEHKHLIDKRVHVEDYEGQDLWKDMVAAEERRLEERKREQAATRQEKPASEPSRPLPPSTAN